MHFYSKTNTTIFSFIKKCELAVFEIFTRQAFLFSQECNVDSSWIKIRVQVIILVGKSGSLLRKLAKPQKTNAKVRTA